MLSPLVLIPAFLGTAIYAIATTGHAPPSTFKTSTTSSSSSSTSSAPCLKAPATTEAPPLADRALDSFDPFSIPPIPGFAVPSQAPAAPGPGCARYACFVQCRVGVVAPNCRGCCAKDDKTLQAEEGLGDEE